MSPAVVITTTVASKAAADAIATALVEERLAACVQVAGPVRSTYRWEGRVETAEEWTCHIKTVRPRTEATLARLQELHPYQVPEILVLPVLGGHEPYLEWLLAETT